MRLSDRESGVAARRHGVLYLDAIHARAGRSLMELPFESLNRVGLAFRRRLDAAVGQVSHPTVDALTACHPLDEISKADALDAAADDIPSRNAHRVTRWAGRAGR